MNSAESCLHSDRYRQDEVNECGRKLTILRLLRDDLIGRIEVVKAMMQEALPGFVADDKEPDCFRLLAEARNGIEAVVLIDDLIAGLRCHSDTRVLALASVHDTLRAMRMS